MRSGKTTLSIIYDRDLKEIHGVNKVNESLIQAYKIFLEGDIELKYFVSSKQIIQCQKYKKTMIGESSSSLFKENIVRIMRLIKRLFLNNYIGNLIEVYLKIIIPSKISVKKYLHLNFTSDVLIFQSIHSMYYYLKCKSKKKSNTLLILHSLYDPFDQFFITYPYLHNTNYEKNIRKRFEYLVSSSNKIVLVSNISLAAMKEKYPKYSQKFLCIHNGIRDSKNIKRPSNDSKLKLVIVASLVYRKGHDILIESVSLLPKEFQKRIEVNIIGDGPLLDSYKIKVNKIGLTSSFIFWGNRNDIEEILPQMDVFILPSRLETLPISIIEAFRAGLPVIATNVGGIPEMVIDKYNGYLVDPTSDSLCSALTKIIKNCTELEYLSKNARNTYEKEFSEQKMIYSYINTIKEMD